MVAPKPNREQRLERLHNDAGDWLDTMGITRRKQAESGEAEGRTGNNQEGAPEIQESLPTIKENTTQWIYLYVREEKRRAAEENGGIKKMRKEKGGGGCGKPICEHKRSTSVVTRFFQNRRKQILLQNLKKTFTFYLSYTLFRLTGKICCFFYPAVSVAAKEGALYGRWGGQKWRQLYFQQRTQNTTTDLTGHPDVVIESIVSIAIMTSV